MFESKFQSFADPNAPAQSSARLAALRTELRRRGLDGFVVTRADPHQNEYVPACEERLAWLTGFTGSAGVAVVLKDRAVLFTDGRYRLQAEREVDAAVFSLEHLIERPPEKWLAENLGQGDSLGYDPWRTTLDGVEKLSKVAARAGAKLVPVDDNPVDAVWRDRPSPPLAPVKLHDVRYAGETAESKLARVRDALAKAKLDAALLSDPASVAWTFNIRGGDVAHTPLPLSWAIVPRLDKPLLFVDGRKLSNEVRDALSALAELFEPRELESKLAAFAAGKLIQLDQTTAPRQLAEIIGRGGGRIDRGADPVTRLKAIKNAVEIEGQRAAQQRDGAALARFLAWLDREARSGKVSEIDAVAALESFRRDTGVLKDISFPTIAGAGPHGAIVHYRVSERSNRKLRKGELFLVDSGAQYEDGTTDVTRTVAIGPPNGEMRERFTRVLKGHIAIATSVFPEGTTGAQLDAFARRPLWDIGLDYDHGTGHGVGSYLSVHEGPARLSKLGHAPLAAGMILSNEPGYYRPGAYGIRIENLVLVAERPLRGAEKKMLGFETLTLVPIDRRLVRPDLLNATELEWLNAYHRRVLSEIGPVLDAKTRRWLEAATGPIHALRSTSGRGKKRRLTRRRR